MRLQENHGLQNSPGGGGGAKPYLATGLQCSYRRKYRKQSNNPEFAKKLYDQYGFHVKDIKFECLNLLLKHEKGKIFCKIRIFYLIEFFIVIIVTDRKCSVADNIVLAI